MSICHKWLYNFPEYFINHLIYFSIDWSSFHACVTLRLECSNLGIKYHAFNSVTNKPRETIFFQLKRMKK